MANKLNQVLAVESGIKTRVYADLSEKHKILQKPELFDGHQKTYRPRDEDPSSPTGQKLPDENRKVTYNARSIVKDVYGKLVEYFDVSAARDWTNCAAKADVVVEEKILIKDCPVTYLLFLEKQLSDLHTFVKKLPLLSPSEEWAFNAGQDLFATKPVETHRTIQKQGFIIAAEATKEHPAQVKEVQESVLAGFWTTVKFSGAFPTQEVNEMVERVEALQKAVKFAREKANEAEVASPKPGQAVLTYLFGAQNASN